MILTTLTPVKYPIHTGNRQIFVGTGTGPASYNATTGDVISVAFVPFFIDAVLGVAITTDGTYIGFPAPIVAGNAGGWTLYWFTFNSTTGALGSASAANISTKTIQLTVIGGA